MGKTSQSSIEFSSKKPKATWLGRSLTKWQIKVYLTIVGLVIVAGVLLFTQSIVKQLIEREKVSVNFYASIFQNLVRSESAGDNAFFLSSVTPTISFPVIVTDAENNPLQPYEQFTMHVIEDSALTPKQQEKIVAQLLLEMDGVYQPINVRDANNKIISRIHYTNSSLIHQLRILPYVEIIIVAVFIGIGYLAFSYLKRNEESHIWVGMSKEAAHQLGTPLSSLLAWIEILRISRDDSPLFDSTVNEMTHDVERLKLIANRFSLIGSQPKMNKERIADIVEEVCSYYEKRVPHIGKTVSIKRTLQQNILVSCNKELISWVFENLVKNAVEAIEQNHGTVALTMQSNENTIQFLVTDSGKGMNAKTRKQIFNPGFTTKLRGWGLGLSLSKRIIEEYHKGKLIIKQTAPNEGTTFLIEIPL